MASWAGFSDWDLQHREGDEGADRGEYQLWKISISHDFMGVKVLSFIKQFLFLTVRAVLACGGNC